jgi:hypothetical protein
VTAGRSTSHGAHAEDGLIEKCLNSLTASPAFLATSTLIDGTQAQLKISGGASGLDALQQASTQTSIRVSKGKLINGVARNQEHRFF